MATVSYKEGPFDSASGYGNTSPGSSSMPPGVKAAMIDCSIQGMAQNDILEALSISAGSIVVEVGIAVLTAEDSTCTLDVGDGTTVDGFLDGVNAQSAAGSVFNSLNAATGADAYSGGKYYASDDTIDVKFLSGAADTFKGVIWCKFFKTNLN